MQHLHLFFASLLLFTWSAVIKAQNTTPANTPKIKQIRFAYGQAYNIKLDRTYSRLTKKGLNHLFHLGYKRIKNERIVEIQGAFMTGTLYTKGNDINQITTNAGGIAIKYLTQIKSLQTEELAVYGGINIGAGWDIWFPKESRLRYGWDINSGVGGALSALYNINQTLSFEYDLDFFLLGILWRSHNNGQQLVTEEIQLEKGTSASAFETPRFAHPFNTIYWDNSFKLIYNLNERFDLYYNFILSYQRLQQPLLKKGYELGNLIGITYNF